MKRIFRGFVYDSFDNVMAFILFELGKEKQKRRLGYEI